MNDLLKKALIVGSIMLPLPATLMASEVGKAPAQAPAKAAAPAASAAPATQPPVILFRQVSEVPIRPEVVEVDGTVSCTFTAAKLRCTARRRGGACASPGSGGEMSHHEVARLIIAATVVVGYLWPHSEVTLFYPLDDVTVEVDDVGIGASRLTAFKTAW